jgi:hypothetical protein
MDLKYYSMSGLNNLSNEYAKYIHKTGVMWEKAKRIGSGQSAIRNEWMEWSDELELRLAYLMNESHNVTREFMRRNKLNAEADKLAKEAWAV